MGNSRQWNSELVERKAAKIREVLGGNWQHQDASGSWRELWRSGGELSEKLDSLTPCCWVTALPHPSGRLGVKGWVCSRITFVDEFTVLMVCG